MRGKPRVLVVEDTESWRRIIVSMLRHHDLETAYEVSDGLAAVSKAAELQPELILLDIGIPKLSGIEAAKQIRKLSPGSKIIFVTQEVDLEIVDHVFQLGAWGYVVKIDVGTELLNAVDAVLRGGKFKSTRLSTVKPPTQQSPLSNEVHEVVFYTDERFLLDHLTQFIGKALTQRRAAIVIVTESHRNSLFFSLRREGLDVSAALKRGSLIVVDALQAMSTFMIDGMPDESQFITTVGDLIVAASRAADDQDAPVALCGEGVDILCRQGNWEATIQVEQMVQVLNSRYKVEVLCSYSVHTATARMPLQLMERIRAEHSAHHYA
jgi:DNA-binding NarL/FixJ family response regulator